MFCFWGTAKILEKKVFWYSRCVGWALALRAQRQPYKPNDNPIGPYMGPYLGPVFPLWAALYSGFYVGVTLSR